MNFKKRVNGSWVDTPNYIHNTSTDTLTTLPAVLYPNATTATVGLKGNTVQNGTLTPDNPIIPQGTGERTENLFDITAATSGKYVRDTDGTLGNFDDTSVTDYIDVSNISTLYPQYFTEQRPVRQWAAFYDSSKTFVSGFSGYNQAIAVPNNAVYVRLTVDNSYASNFTVSSSELESYEPYGIKIPISSAGQTTPIYLGEVETTRKIKKLVLTGNEIWSRTDNCFRMSLPDSSNIEGRIISTHFVYKGAWSLINTAAIGCCVSATYYGSLYKYLMIRCDNIATVTSDFKTYLRQQYANGTPVTVWYVLATEETAVVNEPLMKIGDYADTFSNVSIPVTAGGDTLSVGTTVQPSEVTVNYKGWHPVADVHERDNGAWT